MPRQDGRWLFDGCEDTVTLTLKLVLGGHIRVEQERLRWPRTLAFRLHGWRGQRILRMSLRLRWGRDMRDGVRRRRRKLLSIRLRRRRFSARNGDRLRRRLRAVDGRRR